MFDVVRFQCKRYKWDIYNNTEVWIKSLGRNNSYYEMVSIIQVLHFSCGNMDVLSATNVRPEL